MNLGEQLCLIEKYVEGFMPDDNAFQKSKFRMMMIDFAEDYNGYEMTVTDWNLDNLLDKLCIKYNVSRTELRERNRHREMVTLRTFYCAFARSNIRDGKHPISLAKIAKIMMRHHSSVIHCLRRHNNWMATCDDYRADFSRFRTLMS